MDHREKKERNKKLGNIESKGNRNSYKNYFKLQEWKFSCLQKDNNNMFEDSILKE